MAVFKNFIARYQLAKTLRFELIPIGSTLKFIEQKGLLETDKNRADNYLKVKKIIDNYHKAFIERVLNSLELPFTNKNEENFFIVDFKPIEVCRVAGGKRSGM